MGQLFEFFQLCPQRNTFSFVVHVLKKLTLPRNARRFQKIRLECRSIVLLWQNNYLSSSSNNSTMCVSYICNLRVQIENLKATKNSYVLWLQLPHLLLVSFATVIFTATSMAVWQIGELIALHKEHLLTKITTTITITTGPTVPIKLKYFINYWIRTESHCFVHRFSFYLRGHRFDSSPRDRKLR